MTQTLNPLNPSLSGVPLCLRALDHALRPLDAMRSHPLDALTRTTKTERNMSKKYELLKEDCIEHDGRTLYRIRALRDFKYVGIGQLGGYIEKEENLSHEGEAWVFDNARVFGDARVFSNARVFSSTQVYGDAWVYDNARVFGDARVSGNAWVYGDVAVFGNAQVSGNAWVSGKAWVF